MNAMSVFAFGDNMVRVSDRNGDPWFVLADVCQVLEIRNRADAAARLDDDEKGVVTTDTLGGAQEMTIINESGLYSIVLTSRKPEAKRFRKWITAEVIPSIRKTGRYEMASAQSADAGEVVDVMGFDTADGRMQIAARLDFVRTALRVQGREAARRAWDLSGLPCLLPERGEQQMGDIDATVREWIAERVERAVGARVQSSLLYADYLNWCRRNASVYVSQKAFSQALALCDFRSRKSSGVYFLDIRLRQGGSIAIAA